jgi:PHD/YefM family antitoxin component YafN of YafNO toxin-antitoxin module
VVITQNGKPAAVLITPEEYDEVQEHRRFLSAIQEGLDDVTAGRTFSDEELDAELETELGWK